MNNAQLIKSSAAAFVLFLLLNSVAPFSSHAAVSCMQAPQVNSATLVDRNTISVNLSFGGGCFEHTFSLAFDGRCLESFPNQTSATVIDLSEQPDPCKAFLTRDVDLDISGLGTCRPAILTIKGANNTSATIEVPE